MKNIFLLILFFSLVWAQSQQTDFKSQRDFMVQIQLQGRDITDKATLAAMRAIPRHRFIPEELSPDAYIDSPLPIGEGQTISQPYMVAFMTQALRLKPGDRVLEIGTGSGYQAAVLSEMVRVVYTIEIVEPLALRAKELLDTMGYDNVHVRIGDGYHGWPSEAPFDAIMVTAGAEEIPPELIVQLKEGGRLIIPVGPHNGIRELVLLTKKKGKVRRKNLMPVRFVPFTREKN